MATETANAGYPTESLQECDLVMKGGITSGLVYPAAILELAYKYRLRNIGGTSAGAVAAALAAAAEYRREDRGFERLGPVADELKQDGFIRRLFQGSKETEPLLRVLVRAGQYVKDVSALIARARRGQRVRLVLALGRWLYQVFKDSGIGTLAGKFIGFLKGLALALVLAALIWALAKLFDRATGELFMYSAAVLGLVCGIAGYWMGGLVAGAERLFDLVAEKLPQNLFGICSGKQDRDNPAYTGVAAAEWLLDSVQHIAERPTGKNYLTFDDLSGKAKYKIDLRFMTTDVSAGRPYVLPFDEWFVFNKKQLGRLFPETVVTHLSEHARAVPGLHLPNGYCFLPPKGKWPIAFAARLSMSFPFLFSSVPLYRLPRIVERVIKRPGPDEPYSVTLKEAGQTDKKVKESDELQLALHREGYLEPAGQLRKLEPADLVPHWFSDGGITSNFPIHFFDAWLPERPTLGITLRYVPSDVLDNGKARPQPGGAERGYLSTLGERALAVTAIIRNGQDGDVWLPAADESIPDEWQPIYDPAAGPPNPGSTLQFIASILKTMQNYRDNRQTALESYRERVVQLRLNPNEGGLNLDMPPPQVESVVKKGVRAGTILRDQFTLPHHQWARLRLLFSRLEDAFQGLRRQSIPGDVSKLIADQCAPGSGFPFPEADSAWRSELEMRTTALLALVTSWKVRLDKFESESSLRVTPAP